MKVKRDRRKKRKAAAVEAFHKSNVTNKIKVIGDPRALPQVKPNRSEEVQTPDCNEETSDAESDTPVIAAASTSRGPSPDELEEVDEFSFHHQATDAVPLAAFPMPSEQVAASQKALALQGLDPRLIEAEIVDSTRTIPMDGPDAGLCLGSKIRMRMKELGITELFAGNIFYQSTSKLIFYFAFTSTIGSPTVPASRFALSTCPLYPV